MPISPMRHTPATQTATAITNPDATSVGKIADINTLAKSTKSADVDTLKNKLIDASTQELGALLASGSLNDKAKAMVEDAIADRAEAHTSSKTTKGPTSYDGLGTVKDINAAAVGGSVTPHHSTFSLLHRSEAIQAKDDLINKMHDVSTEELQKLLKDSNLSDAARQVVKDVLERRAHPGEHMFHHNSV